MCRAVLGVLSAVCLARALPADPPASQPLPYATGFRVVDHPPIEAGQTIEAWNGWRVQRGQATVRAFDFEGAPAVRLEPDTVVQRPVVASGAPVVWTEVAFRSAGGPRSLADFPERPLAAVLRFHPTRGLEALDGDGLGGGTFRPTNTVVGGDRWRRLAIRHDFARQRYDVYVDGVPRLLALGFRDHVTELHGFMQGADAAEGGLAAVWISESPPPDVPHLLGDVQINGQLNAGDIVGLVNALHGQSLSLMQRINADIDESGTVDAVDLELLINLILGVSLESPDNSNAPARSHGACPPEGAVP